MKEYAVKISTIVWKDVVSELRTRDIVTSLLVFALLVMVIFNFAFEPEAVTSQVVAAGVLWVAFTFAGILGLSRSLVMEKDKGCLEGLMLCPVDRDVIFVGKMVGSLVFMLIVEIIILPIFAILFNYPILIGHLVIVTFLATVGFTAVGTLFSAIAVNTRAREIMLPILFFPVVVPVLIAAVKASALALAGESWDKLVPWVQIIGAFDIIFVILSAWIFQFVVEE